MSVQSVASPRDRWLHLVKDANPALVEAYQQWARANPSVPDTFLALARQMRAAGKRRYSAWAVVNRIRWDYDIRTTGDEFKIRNDFIAMLARHAIARDPSLEEFFELRQMGRHGNLPEPA